MTEADELDGVFLLEPIRRAPALHRLAAGPAPRDELEDELSVSKATLHRIVSTFVDAGLVRETEAGVQLTGAGRVVEAAVKRYRDRLETVHQLEPLLNGLPAEVEFEVGSFSDAEVVTPSPGHPQRPVQRVVDFFDEATSLRATSAVVLPIYVEVLSRKIVGGMETELVVAPAVIETLQEEYPDRFTEVLDSGALTVLVHDAIEVGLALDEERALVVGTQEGVTQVVVVTDRPAAVDWAESIYERYRAAAVPFEPDE